MRPKFACSNENQPAYNKDMIKREIADYKESQGATEVYSKVVRAGHRTYFFDVKATRGNDYFLTITESRKLIDDAGESHYEKHKIHLYKEDFEKYLNGLNEVIDYIKRTKTYFPDGVISSVPVNTAKDKTQ